jgi:hypothetical protein
MRRNCRTCTCCFSLAARAGGLPVCRRPQVYHTGGHMATEKQSSRGPALVGVLSSLAGWDWRGDMICPLIEDVKDPPGLTGHCSAATCSTISSQVDVLVNPRRLSAYDCTQSNKKCWTPLWASPTLGLSPGFRVDRITVALQSILKEQITGNVSPNG